MYSIFFYTVAQGSARKAHNLEVVCSNHTGVCVCVAQWIAHLTSNQEVAGSSPAVDFLIHELFKFNYL